MSERTREAGRDGVPEEGASGHGPNPGCPGFVARGRSKGTDRESYVRAMFLSRRDCVEVFKRAIEVDTEYLVTYAISDNDDRIFDMRETMEKLAFYPQDNSKDFFDRA